MEIVLVTDRKFPPALIDIPYGGWAERQTDWWVVLAPKKATRK